MKLIKAILLILGMFITMIGHADDYQSTHDWDHFGTSYAIQTFTYGISKKAFRMNTTDAIIFSAVTTFVGTFTYSYFNAMSTGHLDIHTLMYNGIGQAASIGTIYIFKF